jgi:LPPG:FO 2-phospho-L-lactate transferase
MITLISGGTGTPKLIQGLSSVIDEADLSVIVNTAEDHWLSHGYISPDIDSVVYTLAEVVDDSTWHGIRGDTHFTHQALNDLNSGEFLRIGDRDRAVHIWRGEMLTKGWSLSQITEAQCEYMGVKAAVYPMSNDKVETIIKTDDGDLSLHEFWVKHRGEPEVIGVSFKDVEKARALLEAQKAIDESERVIIGPSNPVTSICPIISLKGMRKVLSRNKEKVIGVSPIVGGSAFSGPAEKLMKAFNIEISIGGVAEFYKDLMTYLIVDSSEKIPADNDYGFIKTNIVMDSIVKRRVLAEFILGLST